VTTAYAIRAPHEQRAYIPGPQTWVVSSAHGQGQEARKVSDNVRAISVGTTQGYSLESEALQAAVRNLAQSIEVLQGRLQGADDTAYMHVPLKPAFSVRATYKRMGKLPARQLPEVE